MFKFERKFNVTNLKKLIIKQLVERKINPYQAADLLSGN